VTLPPRLDRKADGLLPVEDIGTPSVWMDRNDCYPKQRHKQCAYNLYSAAMLRHALAPLARAFGDEERALRSERVSREILDATVRAFWSEDLGLFVNNLPWLAEEKKPRMCDRSRPSVKHHHFASQSFRQLPLEQALTSPVH